MVRQWLELRLFGYDVYWVVVAKQDENNEVKYGTSGIAGWQIPMEGPPATLVWSNRAPPTQRKIPNPGQPLSPVENSASSAEFW